MVAEENRAARQMKALARADRGVEEARLSVERRWSGFRDGMRNRFGWAPGSSRAVRLAIVAAAGFALGYSRLRSIRLEPGEAVEKKEPTRRSGA